MNEFCDVSFRLARSFLQKIIIKKANTKNVLMVKSMFYLNDASRTLRNHLVSGNLEVGLIYSDPKVATKSSG